MEGQIICKKMSEHMSEQVARLMAEQILEYVAEHMSEHILEPKSDHMSQHSQTSRPAAKTHSNTEHSPNDSQP